MHITYLSLLGYKRLSLSNIKHFEYRPEKPLQIILGTNGSGKSSILRAMTPTITDSSEFEKGGHKIIHLSANGHDFELSNNYNGGSVKHSFVMDGVEKNPGGTGKVQTELVRTHINYTKYLHTLLTGALGFTEMSRNAREELLLDISGVDFTYALEMYQKVKQSHRDTLGAIKHLAVKYNELSNRLDAMGDIEDKKQQAEILESEICKLLPYTNNSLTEVDSYEGRLLRTEEELKAVIDEAAVLRKRIGTYREDNFVFCTQFESHEDMNDAIIANTVKQEDLLQRIKELGKEMAEVESVVKRLDECPDTMDLDKLEVAIKSLEDSTDNWKSSHIGEYTNATDAKQTLISVHSSFSNYIDRIPAGQKVYTRQEAEAIKAKQESLTVAFNETKAKLVRIEERKHHADLAREGDSTCPHCNERILGAASLDDKRYSGLLQEVQQIQTAHRNAENELNLHRPIHDSLKSFEGLHIDLMTLVKQFPGTLSVWKECGGPGKVIQSPQIALEVFRKEIDCVDAWIEHEDNLKLLDKYKEYSYLLQLSQGDNTMSRFRALEKKLQDTHVEMDNTRIFIKVFSDLREMYGRLRGLSDKADKLMEVQARQMIEWANAVGTKEVTDYVRAKQQQAGALRHTISSWQDLLSRKEYLETSETELREKRDKLALIMKCLSPATGIIGKQLRRSIVNFTDRVNGILARIWEHELRIEIPEDEKNLSYKFRLWVDGEPRPDIKNGSTGEQDVINVAVTLVIMAQKGLQGFPLFLDEVGSSFDYAHRKRFLDFVTDLVDTAQVSQMFMINHFSSQYGGMSNADTVVLNANNIVISGEYNKVVVMA